MDAMTLLHERRSMGKLAGPAPSAEQLDALYRAALRAPTRCAGGASTSWPRARHRLGG